MDVQLCQAVEGSCCFRAPAEELEVVTGRVQRAQVATQLGKEVEIGLMSRLPRMPSSRLQSRVGLVAAGRGLVWIL